MNQKQKWLMMTVMLALSFFWMQVVYPYLAKKNNWKFGPDTTTNQPATGGSTTVASSTSSSTGPATAGSGVVGAVKGAVSATEVVIGSTDYDPNSDKPKSLYPLGVTLSNRGAAITSVTLNHFRNQYDQPKPFVFQTPYEVSSPLAAPLATRGISVGGGPQVSLDSVLWQSVAPVAGSTGNRNSASFTVDLQDNAGAPQLRITKTYEVRDKNDKSAGYEMLVNYAVANLTALPLKVKLAFNGMNTPKSENSRDMQEIVAGFDGGSKNVLIGHTAVGSVKSDSTLDVRAMKPEPILWTGMSSAYFDAILRGTESNGDRLPLTRIDATLLNPQVQDTLLHSVALAIETGDMDVPANGSKAFTLNVFVGPKLRDVIKNDYYSDYPLNYDETLVLTGSWCGILTSAKLINLLVWLLKGFHSIFRDWGLAIIGLVCLVRLILHPITKRSQISMSRMTKMGPEMERLKNKHKDDPDALKKAQMEFYREQGVAPFLGCLPMFLQMPIWIALWSSLQSTFEIRHAPFLMFGGVHLTWIRDLSQPDRLFHFATPLEFWKIHVDAINILPVLMAVMFFIQQKFQPQPVAATPEQEQQQKMMKWMSIFLFPLFLYGQPSGLNLYIFTSTLIGIVESKRIRDHIKERDEKEKAGVVIIDGPPIRRDDLGGGGVRRAKNAPPEKPVGGIAGFMAKLQAMAEQAKNNQDRTLKKGKK